MVSVIVAWAKGTADRFERHVPLKWGGERNVTLGSRNSLNIVFIEGLQNLDSNYVACLKDLGYKLIDGSNIYNSYDKRYNELNRFGDYEKKCFLRWLVLKEIFCNEPLIHFDGDIVFNEVPEIIMRDLGKFTFVLQGCPAFVSTGKSIWLNEYEDNFLSFVKDIDTYSAQAWKERYNWEYSFKHNWAGDRYRKIISSDQDLISHLIHTGRLPQDNPAAIKKSTDMVLFENPLFFFTLNEDLLPVCYERKGGVDFFNKKKIAFWHMQSNFRDYLIYFIQRGYINKLLRCGSIYTPKALDQGIYTVIRALRKAHVLKRLESIDVYKYFFEQNNFSCVFNNKTFWKGNLFPDGANKK